MTEPAKGMIRWWDNRVMGYQGERHGEWNHDGAQKWIERPYVDKPCADEFTATMQLEGFYRGRSAAGFTFKGENGIEHIMRIKCVTDLLKNATLVRGRVSGVWCYVKQGSNFSLKYLRQAANNEVAHD